MADAEHRAAFDGLRLATPRPSARRPCGPRSPRLRYGRAGPAFVLRRCGGGDLRRYAGAADAGRPCDRAHPKLPGGRPCWSTVRGDRSAAGAGKGLDLDLDRMQRQYDRTHGSSPSTFPTTRPGEPAQATFAALIDLCSERGIWLFSDEVIAYSNAIRPGVPQAVDAYERGISLERDVQGGAGWARGSAGSPAGTGLSCSDAPTSTICDLQCLVLGAAGVIALKAREPILAQPCHRRRNLAVLDTFFGDYPELFDGGSPLVAASAALDNHEPLCQPTGRKVEGPAAHRPASTAQS